jgi:peptidoglycan/LPS O-acetylase OafA/YrhL
VKHIVSLDLLRGIAAFAVAIPHFLIYHDINANFFEAFSAISVEVFFVLSGFVLAPQILQLPSGDRLRNLRTFLVRRWMRTIPPYLVALLLISILLNTLFTRAFFEYLFYVQNFISMSKLNDFFPIAWSLSVEEWFYICFPPIIILCATLTRTHRIMSCIVTTLVFIVVVSVARIHFGDGSNWGMNVRRVVVFRIDSIAYGFGLYVVNKIYLAAPLSNRQSMGFVGLLALLTGFAFMLTMKILTGAFLSKQFFPFASALFGMATVQLFLFCDRYVRRSSIVSRLGLLLGRISYSVYLFHLIIITILTSRAPHVSAVTQFGIYVVTLGTFCYCFYRWFEKPILLARPDYGSRSVLIGQVA